MFTIYSADVTGNPGNCSYPHRFTILEAVTLKKAVSHDYVCAEYRGGCRSGENFLSSDCLAVDCDNDHTEDPSGWVTPADVMAAFPGVGFAVHYSRNNMRPKKGRAPRPKFHILFPIARVTDAAEYSAMKRAVCRLFPYFDSNALDAARFFFGTDDPKAEYWPGGKNLTEFLSEAGAEGRLPKLPDPARPSGDIIPAGQRNATLSRFAAKVLKKCGNSAEARKAFDEKASLCSPPLGGRELEQIWNSAVKFYERISTEESYVPPEEYAAGLIYSPKDHSDLGQAYAFAEHCRDFVRYSPATDYIVYDGVCWQESKPRAQAAMQQFTDAQFLEAGQELQRCEERMKAAGADRIAAQHGKNASLHMDRAQKEAFLAYQEALAYRKFVLQRRDSKYLVAALHEARPMVEIDQRELDKDPFLLNTPQYTVDLRKGMDGIRPHDPADFITKCTALDPGRDGEEIWEEALYTFFCGDAALEA